jgi:glyoxylate reductase
VCLLTDKIDAHFLESSPSVRIVANVAVGYDNIDVEAARKRSVVVTNTPGVLTDATADFAFALLMATARRVTEAERFLRSGKYKAWDMMLMLGGPVWGATLGIAGFGRIGQAVARRGRGFNMRILYTDEARVPESVERELGATFVDKATLLRESDFISLHVPLMESTRHYIGEAELRAMKPTAYLINTSRGPVVDEAALGRALRERRIAGAGLDVFEREPEVHPDLLAAENVVIAPHIASATVPTRTQMAMIAADNVLAVLAGKPPLTPVT